MSTPSHTGGPDSADSDPSSLNADDGVPTNAVAASVGQPPRDQAMKAGKQPVGTGASPLFAQLLGLALIALGVLGVQEALFRTGLISTPSWTSATVDAFNGIARTAFWILVAGVVAVILGVLLILVVFKRRPRKTVALQANTGVYLRTRDLSRIAETILDGTDTVTDVRVKASRRRLNVEAATVGPKSANRELTDEIKTRMEPTLGTFQRAPRLKVKLRNEGGGGNETAGVS